MQDSENQPASKPDPAAAGGVVAAVDDVALVNPINQRRRMAWCVALAAVLPFTMSFIYFVWLADEPASRVIYTAVKVFTFIWPIIAIVWITKQYFPWREAFERRHLRAMPLGVLTGGLIGGLILVGYYFTPVGDHVETRGDEIAAHIHKFRLEHYYIPFAIFLSVVHSLIEEYFWRWYVFGQIAKLVPVGLAYLLGSAAFAAHHFVVLSAYFPPLTTALFGIGVGIGGAIWCWQYRKQKSLAGAWISHMLVDAAFLYVGYGLAVKPMLEGAF